MEGVTASPHLQDEDEDVAQSVGESFTNLLGAQSHSSGSQDQKQPRLQTDGWEPLTPVENSLYLKFQDSNLSPTLSLLPVISEVQHNLTEFSLFHQSDTEFAPLRAHPDISMASGRFDIPPQDRTTPFSDRGSLSQHPLAQATILSEEGANSCFSLSQHSLSLSNRETQEDLGHPSMTDIRQELRSRGDRGSREKNSEIPGYPRDMRVGGSPYKGEYSRSSVLSVDSSVSIPFSLDSLGPAASIPEPARLRTFPPSDTESVQTGGRLAPLSQPDEIPHPSSLTTSQQPRDNTQDISRIGDRSDPDLSLTTKASGMGRKSESLLRSKRHEDQGVEDSLVSTNAGSENIKEIKTSGLQNLSLSSTSTAAGLRTHTSDLWTRSSSHSMPASEKKRQSSVGREVTSSSQQTDNPPLQAVPAAPTTGTFKTPQDRSVVNSKGTSVVLSKSVQRTEPEGCSAVPPDNAPAQLQAVTAPAAVSTQQLAAAAAAAAVTGLEEEDKAALGVIALSRSSSAIVEEGEEGDSSDGSSQSSLAVRVAKLLQKESPSTLVSSTPSITDQEDGRAIEWVKLKTSERCEPLELDLEDRKRIEEIKRELLLRNPLKSQGSTDTESSSGFSVKVHKEQNAPDSVETFSTLTDSNNRRGLSVSQPDSSARGQSFPPPDLEARVCEIADREGITLPAKKPQAFPSATFASCKRSASPLLSSSPVIPPSSGSDPLHLTELSAGTVRPPVANKQLSPDLDGKDRTTLVQQTTRTPSNVEWSGRSVTPQSVPATQKRQDTLGGRGEELPSPVCGLQEDMTGNQELSAHPSPVSGVDPVDQATAPSSVGNSTWTGLHSISNVHLSLSTEASSAVHSSHVDAVSEQPRGAFLPLRNSSAASSPDEGVGSSSPVENYEPREPGQSEASLKNVPQGRATARSLKSAVPPHQSDTSRPHTVPFAPVPVLLPYKPRGSDELFYVPQAEADVSSEEPSDTTVESSHTGSDDAVPPRFSSEVLGHQDPGLDRGITFRHAEGIYNKRMKTAFKMQQPEHRDVSAAGEKSSPTVSRALKPVPLPRVSRRDQGTSPVQFPQHEPSEPGVHVHVEKVQTRVPQDRQRTVLPQPARQRSSSTLDQLWQKFCDRWTVEESHVVQDRDAALVERLERLSRLIHGTRAAGGPPVQGQGDIQPPHKLRTERERREGGEAYQERRRDEHSAAREVERIQLRLRAEKPLQPAESSRASLSSSVSHGSSQTSPAPADRSETLSTTSMSTVDTERLIRAFGAHRVQRLSGSSSLSRLYSSINKQRGEGEWGGGVDPRHLITPSGTTGTDEVRISADPCSHTVKMLEKQSFICSITVSEN
ncbi:centrosome-associated protein ALMS1 [Cololabis saira]|uniref:centrosome-associated protein ALMS1 n=1 Tax=Cololabis saira TaxID=129043 RepID=UPI002AD3F2AA|nr:centrosome-associated protein ALMS1 [Cololabis saira]